jgi:hypothetical protein
MARPLKKAVLAASLLSCAACLSIDTFDRVNKQAVLIETPYVRDATCSATDRTGRRSYTNRTPDTVLVEVGRPPLTIACWKDGYKKPVVQIEERYERIRALPHVLEELTGFAKDPFKLPGARYPSKIKIWLEPHVWKGAVSEDEWRKEKAAYDAEVARQAAERRRRLEALEELELILAYRKKNESLRDGTHRTRTELFLQRLGGGAMIPELAREGEDLDPSLNNRTAEEVIEQFLQYKKQELLRETERDNIR